MSEPRHVHHRKDYKLGELREDAAGDDPIALFGSWLEAAERDGLPEPHAMSLATMGSHTISSRVVLLRMFDRNGFVFYTNLNSRKAMDIERDPRAALLFFWPDHERQVRIEGKVEHVSEAESDAYFTSRPLESRIGAWSSDQSRVVEDREQLEQRFLRWKERFSEGEVPRPMHWGGFRVRPVRIEFWQGRENRLHDRLVYEHMNDGTWMRMRLQP
jgi:pyridoxamine 5'-phosphate oxidase